MNARDSIPTDLLFNPQTGHGVECLCDRCIALIWPQAELQRGHYQFFPWANGLTEEDVRRIVREELNK